MSQQTLRVGILFSGQGSRAAAVIDAAAAGQLAGVEVVGALTNSLMAMDSSLIQARLLPQHLWLVDAQKSATFFGEDILRACQVLGADFLVQCGWRPLMPANVLQAFPGRVLNVHPGPLDPKRHRDFGGSSMFGRRVHAAVLLFARQVGRPFMTEATVHSVAARAVEEDVVLSQVMEIQSADSPELLQMRVRPVEVVVLLEALRQVVAGKLTVQVQADPLILPGEYDLLREARHIARLLYPAG